MTMTEFELRLFHINKAQSLLFWSRIKWKQTELLILELKNKHRFIKIKMEYNQLFDIVNLSLV